ncbi:MAG: putative transrane efflux protein [Conexibacter sp.]|nr:putative transrane efflux protein [Conexibacter sp.]
MSHSAVSPARPVDSPRPHPRRWLAALVMIVAALMDLVDATIVNVALPTVRRDLNASATQLEWLVSAYLLAFAATLILAGRLGDLLGRRRLFLLGVAGFGLASLLCGLAQTPGQLIAARALEGVAGATLTPQVLATFRTLFEGKERGAAFGLYGAAGGIASAAGLVLGGVLTDADLFGWGWRTIFLVNVPVAAAVLAAAAVLVPESRAPAARRPDLLGSAVLAGALVAIVAPLLEGRRLGWPLWCWLTIALGLLALAGLGLLDARRRRAAPLPTRLLAVPAVGAGLLVQLVFSAALQGFVLVFALWLQGGQQFSPLRAGLTTLAFSVGAFLTAGAAVPLAVRFGRLVLAGGGVLMAAGIIGVDIAAHHAGARVEPWALVPGLVIAGAGLGLLVVPLVDVVLSAIPADEAGEASGVFSTAQQLGGALGVALVGSLFFGYVGHGSTAAFTHAAPFAAAGFVACALLSLGLPRTAVTEVA